MQQSTKPTTVSVARVYADVNSHQPREYWDYESFTPTWHSAANYEVVRRLGRGKYAEVFEAIEITTNTRCVVKILKPIKKKRIRREVLILQNLRGCTNIVQLYETVKDQLSKTCSIVTEYIDTKDFKLLYPTFTADDIRYYAYQILIGLDEAHSHGIMHRDIKPHNLVIDHNTRTLRIIDWGLAEFYHPQTEYHIRVASRSFKGPELLVNMPHYDYSLDIWSFGATLAGMVFLVHPFFYGKDNLDQLTKIAKVCGSQAIRDYIRKYSLQPDRDVLNAIGNYPRKSLKAFENQHNQRLVSDDALDLIEKLLVVDHEHRLTAREAMAHPYFDPIRQQVHEHLAKQKQQKAGHGKAMDESSIQGDIDESSQQQDGVDTSMNDDPVVHPSTAQQPTATAANARKGRKQTSSVTASSKAKQTQAKQPSRTSQRRKQQPAARDDDDDDDRDDDNEEDSSEFEDDDDEDESME